MLCLMRVVLAGINMKVPEDGTSKPVLREHSFNCFFNNSFRLFRQKIFRCFDALTSRIAGMANILLIAHLFPGQFHFLSIDHYYIITTINMRSITWLMFSPEYHRNYRSKPSQYLITGIDNVPLLLNSGFICRCGLVT